MIKKTTTKSNNEINSIINNSTSYFYNPELPDEIDQSYTYNEISDSSNDEVKSIQNFEQENSLYFSFCYWYFQYLNYPEENNNEESCIFGVPNSNNPYQFRESEIL